MENDAAQPELGELDQLRWAVVSTDPDRCEATDLTYDQALAKVIELKSENRKGLTIVTAEAAAKLGGANAGNQ